MKKTFIFYLGLCAAGVMQAQEAQDEKRIWISESQYFTSSVNNNGEAIGYVDQVSPYEIWIPQMGERIEIGGISAGNGIGGLGRFSDDGNLISGVRYNDNIRIESAWTKYSLEDNSYRINAFALPSNTNLLAIGSSKDKQTAIVLRSTNQGKTWKPFSLAVTNIGETGAGQKVKGGLECICCLSWAKGLAGGHNGAMYDFNPGNGMFTQIDIHPAGNTDEVKTFWAIDFLDIEANYVKPYGVFGLELADGTGAVWYTEDGADTFEAATGVNGVPVCITHNGNNYFMTTRNGMIQKSTDYGKTWQTVYELGGGISPWSLDNGSPMEEIRFSDENNGIATGVGCIYVTADGGDT